MEQIEIQVKDINGNSRTYNMLTQNNSQLTLMAIRALKEQFPDQRVRAVDQNGRLVDFL